MKIDIYIEDTTKLDHLVRQLKDGLIGNNILVSMYAIHQIYVLSGQLEMELERNYEEWKKNLK